MEAHTIPPMSRRFEIAVEETRGLLSGGVARNQLEKVLQESIKQMDKVGDATMIREGQRINEVEQPRQAERKTTPWHPVIDNPRIARTEDPEQGLFVPVAPSMQSANVESFITDWADS